MTEIFIDPNTSSENIVVLTRSAIMFADLPKSSLETAQRSIRDGAHVVEILGSDCTSIPYTKIKKLVSRDADHSLEIDHSDDSTVLYLADKGSAERAVNFVGSRLPDTFKRSEVQQSALTASMPSLVTLIGAAAVAYWTYGLITPIAYVAGAVALFAAIILFQRMGAPPRVTTYGVDKSAFGTVKSAFGNLVWMLIVGVGAAGFYQNYTDSKGPSALVYHWYDTGEYRASDIQKYVERGADINFISDEYDESALMVAAQYANEKTLRAVISGGADLDLADSVGNTALHMAVYSDDVAATQVLLEAGANPNLMDSSGDTPLSIAAIYENLELTKLLLKYKAATSYPNTEGEMLVVTSDNEEIQQLLK